MTNTVFIQIQTYKVKKTHGYHISFLVFTDFMLTFGSDIIIHLNNHIHSFVKDSHWSMWSTFPVVPFGRGRHVIGVCDVLSVVWIHYLWTIERCQGTNYRVVDGSFSPSDKFSTAPRSTKYRELQRRISWVFPIHLSAHLLFFPTSDNSLPRHRLISIKILILRIWRIRDCRIFLVRIHLLVRRHICTESHPGLSLLLLIS